VSSQHRVMGENYPLVGFSVPGLTVSIIPVTQPSIKSPRNLQTCQQRETAPIPPLLTAAIKTNAPTLSPAANSVVLLLRCALLLRFSNLAFFLNPLCRSIHHMMS
jgi:hypothetical protein